MDCRRAHRHHYHHRGTGPGSKKMTYRTSNSNSGCRCLSMFVIACLLRSFVRTVPCFVNDGYQMFIDWCYDMLYYTMLRLAGVDIPFSDDD